MMTVKAEYRGVYNNRMWKYFHDEEEMWKFFEKWSVCRYISHRTGADVTAEAISRGYVD